MIQVFNKKNRILLGELVRTDFKLRYQGSTLGYVWSLLRPLFLFGILYIVFGQILKIGKGIPNYPVYLLTGIVVWNFFTEAVKQGTTSIVNRGSILRKIFFPKYIIVLSSSVSALINLGLNLFVVLLFILISGADIQWYAVIVVPLLIIELYILSIALAFILSAINVKYRDVQHIVDILIQAGFYATPIIYPLYLVVEKSESLATLMLTLNPTAQIIQDMRYVLITTEAQTLGNITHQYTLYLIPIGITLILLMYAVYYFRKKAKYFTEDL